MRSVPSSNAGAANAKKLAATVRRSVIEQSKRANVGHIGSALSVADVLAALFSGPLAALDVTDPDRNRFVMSKGHAALALYAAMVAVGSLSAEELDTFCSDGTQVVGHPEHTLPGIDFSTGSLGQGVSVAAGAALAARLQGSERRVYALMSDAEFNEGSVWEAAMFAAQHKLGNLIVLADVNGQQALGHTRDILDLEPLADRWNVFRWDVQEVDGHDPDALSAALESAASDETTPHMILARTTFGSGVAFMESRIEWHYLPMSDNEYGAALRHLGDPQ